MFNVLRPVGRKRPPWEGRSLAILASRLLGSGNVDCRDYPVGINRWYTAVWRPARVRPSGNGKELAMTPPCEIYLDIETDWQRRLTVVGFQSSTTGVVQLVGSDITADRLEQALPAGGMLFTYNGH